ncbi:hypothetical protein ACRDNQ_03980 [Palleronia sp. KMU-117]|uniref:hypothetical protein n=1 Tax=Palleronia sp. KMU-117 TaxID=3434108 RepID=UPI003D70B1C3
MAIAFDNATGNQDSTSGTNHTVSFTVGTGLNRIMFVGICTFNSGGSNKVTGVTYAGVSMTQIGPVVAVQSNEHMTMWYLLNPTSGTNNIVASFSSSQAFSWLAASAYSGVDQAVPEANSSGNGVGITETGTVTTLTNNAWAVMMGFNNGNSLAAGTATTLRDSSSFRMGAFDSGGAISPAGSTTLTYTGANDTHGHVIVSIAPAGGAAAAKNPLFFGSGL